VNETNLQCAAQLPLYMTCMAVFVPLTIIQPVHLYFHNCEF